MKKIYHFFHCAMINHWQELFTDHMTMFFNSGLASETTEMIIGCVGSEEEFQKLKDAVEQIRRNGYDKITIGAHSENLAEYEYITLKLLRKKCEDDPNSYVYYSHTKGVSYPKTDKAYTGGRTWFDYMDHFNCLKWKDAIKVLDFGYDCYGVKLIPQRVSPSEKLHYSGNSWWAKSDYVNWWDEMGTIDMSNRFHAEMQCGQGNPITYTVCQLFVDYICTTPFKELLDGGHVKTLQL